jgi:hypothetical protein
MAMSAFGRCLAAVVFGWMASGCVLLVGAGAGAGAYSYVNGELARTYPAPYTRTMDVLSTLLQDLGMPVQERTSDGTGTRLEAERKDGTPVTIRVTIAGVDRTEVGVRTGRVGFWERDLSEQFQEYVARRLQP